MKRKNVLRIIIVLILLLIASYFFYIYPREIYEEYNGIYYKLGDSTFSEKITVKLEGYLENSLGEGAKFTGTLQLGNQILEKSLILQSKDGIGIIRYFDKDTQDYVTYGTLYSKAIKEGFTISILGIDDNGERGSWSSGDGYMISAPASNREEALELSNQLMENELGKYEVVLD
ncbi:hypothetical protein I5677_14750 [Mobilitalea sibirica]|uniref:Uncharacterized protein n=1 Tax=Mobilitalea sibirica TaxID=1462919 RepID=A0A8J7H0U1_9FIRM|nr:hypothetical protein [Mobilitalea sibirica]MBH1942159.1 hypothetical protein [Mobilitalea sibirica]